ncbi:MAG TPA: TonB family protein [Cryomorphaceae bacterium]|nr:TonB family protein [Cryomorphaceae bacterium]
MNRKKAKNSDIEKWRMPLFLLGVTFSAAVVLSAFEWRTPNESLPGDGLGEINTIELEPEPILVSAMRPPKPPEQSKLNPDKLAIVKKLSPKPIEAKTPKKDFGGEPWVEPIDFPPELYDEEPVRPPVDHPDVYPEFPGGEQALFNFLGEHTRYPQRGRDAGLQGKVYIEFVVNENGDVEQVAILKGLGMGFDREAIRVISAMPKWKPGLQNGKKVAVRYRLPIHFILQK